MDYPFSRVEVMPSLDQTYLSGLNFSHTHLSTLNGIGRYRGSQELYIVQAPEMIQALRNVALIESSESSNRIEGITAPKGRIKDIVVKRIDPRNRSEQEIAGYRDALSLIHDSHEHMGLTVNVILQLHTILHRYMSNEGGRWKLANNDIIEKNLDGTIKRIRFQPVSAVETPIAMDRLVTNYQQAIKSHEIEPLVLAPLAILDFLCVHPFLDGNGRTSRLLTLMLLYQFGYNVGRFISLERIMEESKETYYEALEQSSYGWHESQHNCFPWLTYFWGMLIRAYKEFEERAQEFLSSKIGKTEMVKKAILRQVAPFVLSDLAKECPYASVPLIKKALADLKSEEKVISEGRGRGAVWSLAKQNRS